MNRQRWTFAVLAFATNIVLVTILALSLQPRVQKAGREIFATIYNDKPLAIEAPQPLTLSDVSMEVEQAPEIQIDDAHPADAVSVQLTSQVLAPRPDPIHYNEPPALPPQCTITTAGQILILKVFVSREGTVSDAAVLKSSGTACLDSAALTFVKQNWRFLPALSNGVALDDWTSVGVKFRTAG